MRQIKDQLYEQVARIGKAVASPRRLELIDLLCQGEKSVELLAAQAGISVKLASAHLRELRLARLVDTRKDGKYVVYRLASASVADLWVAPSGRWRAAPRVHANSEVGTRSAGPGGRWSGIREPARALPT